ncbi:MAG: hypothetical protein HQ596_04335 [Candidatus Saganbacteria bacterium]|nr:hypothetical protein [Candidatus Saganbacteria bacterium]
MSEYSGDLTSQSVSLRLPGLYQPSRFKDKDSVIPQPLNTSVSGRSVELSSSDREQAGEIAKQEADLQVKALVDSAIQLAEATANSLARKLIDDETPENRQAYDTANTNLNLVKSNAYYTQIYSDNFDSFYREAYSSALDKVKQEKIAKIQEARDGYINYCALSIGLLPAMGVGIDAAGYGNNSDMDIRALIPSREVEEGDLKAGYPEAGIYFHARFSLNGREYRDGGFFKENKFAQIPLGVNIGIFARFGGCIDAGSIDVCPSGEVGAGFDPLHIIGGAVHGFSEGGALGFLGMYVGFAYGLEFYFDAGVNIGPVGIRGGIYPNGRSASFSLLGGIDLELTDNQKALILLNPGFRIEWTY